MEQPVLLFEGQIVVDCVGFCGLEFHVRIGDFGYAGKQEDCSQGKDERRNRQINPLHIAQRILIVKCEKNVRSHHWCDYGSYTIESLGDIDSDFGIFWRSAH